MKIHIVSTINGLENEGMRNIATHLSRELEKENIVTYSGLRDIFGIIRNGAKSDVTIVFARLIKPVYRMLSIVRPFVKNICVVCVQPISDEFALLQNRKKVADCCFTLLKDDVNGAFSDDCVYTLPVGINKAKFAPNTTRSKSDIKKELGLPTDKILVLHVGHCSSGRGLEDMLVLKKDKYHCVVVASGMFDDEAVINTLKQGGIDVRFGFVKNIEDYYNAADVYLFPTKSSEFVISIPLSVMESLSCGTPVVAYKSFDKIGCIHTTDNNAVKLINTADELDDSIDMLVNNNLGVSLLDDTKEWADVAKDMVSTVEKHFGV